MCHVGIVNHKKSKSELIKRNKTKNRQLGELSIYLLSLLQHRAEESVEELGIADALVYHHLRVHGDGGESGEGVDLVEYETLVGGAEEVHAGESAAVKCFEDCFGILSYLVLLLGGETGGEIE